MLCLLGPREQIFIQMPGKIQSLTDPVECVISSSICGQLTGVINGKPNSVLYLVNLARCIWMNLGNKVSLYHDPHSSYSLQIYMMFKVQQNINKGLFFAHP